MPNVIVTSDKREYVIGEAARIDFKLDWGGPPGVGADPWAYLKVYVGDREPDSYGPVPLHETQPHSDDETADRGWFCLALHKGLWGEFRVVVDVFDYDDNFNPPIDSGEVRFTVRNPEAG